MKQYCRYTHTPELGPAFHLTTSPMLCFRVNEDGSRGNILAINEAFEKRYGYSIEQACEMTVVDLVAPEYRVDLLPLDIRFSADSIRSFETIHVLADGTRVNVAVRANLLEDSGLHYVLYAITILGESGKKDQSSSNFERRVRLRTRELEDVNQTLRDKNSELHRREMLFESAQELGGLGSWSYNFSTEEQLCSHEVYRILGLPEDTHLSPSLLLDMVPEEQRKTVLQGFKRSLQTREPTDIRVSVDAGDGLRKDIHVRGIVEQDSFGRQMEIHGFIRDLSAEVERSSRARLGEDIFRSIFLSSTSVMLIIDADSKQIVRANEAACRFYGYSRQQLEGMHITFINTMSNEEICRRMTQAKKQKQNHFSFIHRLSNGEERDVEVYSGPVNMLGKNVLYSIVIDVTEKRRAEEALLQAKADAERASHAKSQFLANMSHEIRTPLNGVLGMLQLLRQTVKRPEEIGYVDTALDSGRNLLRLISDILDLSRVEAGRMDVDRVRFDMNELLQRAVELFRRTAEEKNLTLRLRTHKDLPPYAHGDEVRIRQILFNLIGNAIKFTHVGGVSIWVEVIRDGKGPLLLFTVEDSGIGIPPEMLDEIFSPFTQADNSHTRKYQGSGLGLSIVQRLAHLLGGTLSVESEPGEGTSIAFTVRIDLPEEDRKRPPKSRKHVNVERKTLNVLLVEDERVNRITAQRMLEKAGHQVICAENGEQALTMLNENCVDCVLMDIQMPVMDGVEALRHIRDGKTTASPKIPIIALTAHAMAGDRERLLGEGMNAYLTKPISAVELLRTVDEFGNAPSNGSRS
ncbi:ATP-binding protein [Salidesulfovibrio brasiliensis]|uniref:ATP-binding protein n=1 Tax=Salidesulfovibrio brasiliensis TaxID=221711 RepID=UPI0006CF4DF3|nr:ATP-binding protein [Salidesulfovibrio brasiliensis]